MCMSMGGGSNSNGPEGGAYLGNNSRGTGVSGVTDAAVEQARKREADESALYTRVSALEAAQPAVATPTATKPPLVERTPVVDVPQETEARWGERYYRSKTARGTERSDNIGSVARFGAVGDYRKPDLLGSAA